MADWTEGRPRIFGQQTRFPALSNRVGGRFQQSPEAIRSLSDLESAKNPVRSPVTHNKSACEFGEWLCMDVLKKIPHRHFVFSIPKILRRYFLYDRKLLADLSRCAWESLKIFLQEAVPENDPFPGAVIYLE